MPRQLSREAKGELCVEMSLWKGGGAVGSLRRNNKKLGPKVQQNISLIVAIKKYKLLRNGIAIKLIKPLLSYF